MLLSSPVTRGRARHEPAGRALHPEARSRMGGRAGASHSLPALRGCGRAADRGARAHRGLDRGLRSLGGEIAALAVIDACVRLIPGVMGKGASAEEESFENGLLEDPHYTRPRKWRAGRFPTCCSTATTRRSPSGGGGKRSGHPAEKAGLDGTLVRVKIFRLDLRIARRSCATSLSADSRQS